MSESNYKKQVYGLLFPALALAILGFALMACGKRPVLVDPPDDVVDDHYPLTYPDPATDPGYVAKPAPNSATAPTTNPAK